MKQLFASLILLSACLICHGQKYELGEVTKAELLEKAHPADSAAVAAVLFKKARTSFKYSDEKGFETTTEFLIKIKIYKKEGLGWANFEIPYFTGYDKLDDDAIEISKAFTYNLVDGKVEKEKVSGQSRLTQTFNENWKIKSIAFSNVKIGSVIELKYKMTSQDLSSLPDFQYQYSIPVNYAEYTTAIPGMYNYKTIKSGFVEVEMKEKLEPMTQTFREKVSTASYQDRSLSYNQVVTTYKASNIPALIKEAYVNSMDNYYGKLEHELQVVEYPGEKPKQIASTWESVAKTIFESKYFGAELSKSGYFLEDLKRAVGNTDITDQQKLSKVFYFIRDRMAWDGKYGYFTNKGVENAYGERTGNAAEINLALTAALKMAGLDARPILISTRDNGVAKFPNTSQFNYVIVGVKLDGKTVLLDATSKNSHPDILPMRDLNWSGRMIGKDGTSAEVDLMPKIVSNDLTSVLASISTDGILEGKLKEMYFNADALDFSENYGKMANETQKQRLESTYKGIEILDYTFTDKASTEAPAIESYGFRQQGSVDIIGDKMFFSPMIFLAMGQNPFKQEKREYDIDFAYANQDKYQISLTIPEGYVVETLPKSVSIAMGQDMAALKYIISNSGNKIQLSLTLDVNTAIIPADYYQELKAFFAEVVKKQNEKIVLKKA